MTEQTALEFQIEVSAEDIPEDEIDEMTRQLLSELKEADVESVSLAKGNSAPAGTKAADPVIMGTIVMTVLPAVLPKIVEMIQAWVMRGNGRTVKFKGKIGKQQIEFEGHPEELQKLIATLSAGGK